MELISVSYIVIGLISMFIFAVRAAKEETSVGTLWWILIGILWAILLTLTYIYIYSHVYIERLTNLWQL